ncbi:MAG: succinate dehydrogenase assembly factor 2 [Alphaproteobacteria bacterium]|nr:succinate dehydrogenase assembly factor 2 [Alphaproteobacteria bacterium]
MKQNDALKKLVYRARYRSSREADLIFKDFVEQTIEFLTEAEQEIFSALMQKDDLTLFKWIDGSLECPERKYHLVLEKIHIFMKNMKNLSAPQ